MSQADSDALALARACARHMLDNDAASRTLGMRLEIPAPGEAVVTMQVTSTMVNGHGICHGGIIFTLADSAFAFACNAYNKVTVSAGAHIDYLSPAREGEILVAYATELKRGRRRGVYDVTVRASDRTVALFRGSSVSRETPTLPDSLDPANL